MGHVRPASCMALHMPPPTTDRPLYAAAPPVLPNHHRAGQLRTLVTAADAPTKGGDGKPLPPAVVRGVAFDASGRFLLAGGEDKSAGLRLWDCATWELLQTMCVHVCMLDACTPYIKAAPCTQLASRLFLASTAPFNLPN